jgi:predicted RND superfamily exporter protein
MDEKNETNQLARIENTKIVEIINQIPNLTDKDKYELTKQIASDDVDVRKSALDKITQSQIAQHDLKTIMNELSALNKEGVYVKSKQTIETGSGQFEIEMKGGDRKLIVPVMVILGVVLIAVLLILFWG